MKKEYIEPSIKAIKIKPVRILAGSDLSKDDFGGGSGDGNGAVVNSLDADFDEED